ncbi:unnamed protein product [Paramecium pentaurelia]|uniref:CS domain-containing protein n=1 Tax=Paramecium pentaurelia TaxID=43138 RepID=A0A8S1UL87_9CILI|nr:unnamed protein product [Paramecium pentaurelia]
MNYEWFQDDNQIKLRFEIKNTKSDNLDIQVADVVVKVNVLDKKFAKTIDLLAPVIEGNIKYGADVLEVTLIKVQPGKWPQLSPSLNKEELILRRKDAFLRKDQEIQAQKKLKEDLKHQFDQHATKEQIKVDDRERNLIRQKQEQQKTEAISDLYNQIGQDSKFKQNELVQQEVTDDQIEDKLKKYEEFEKQQDQNQKQKPKQSQPISENNDIFTNEDIKKQEKQANGPIPEPRKAAAVQMTFTEKIYPHLAAREQHFKDAPVPRQKNIPITEQRENPLFLKDKADEFFRNKDYYSAINAYSAAFKYDNQMFACISNRAACYLALFNFQECIDDCQTIIKMEKKDQLYDKCLKRLKICQAWKGDLDEALNGDLPEEAKQIIQNRIESNKYKNQGDAYMTTSQYQKAIEMYQKSLQYDFENELSLSNIGLAYMKLNQTDKALESIEKAIQKVKPFLQYVNLNPNIGRQSSFAGNEFLLKNLMKKSNCLFELNQEQDALNSVKQALIIDETNAEARSIMNKIQDKLIKQDVLKLKEIATERLKQQQYSDSLELYNQCLKKLSPQEDLMDFLAVLLNRCICCFFLNQFDEIVGSCTRGIKIIQIQQNKILSFEKITKEQKDKLQDFLVRFYVRRSNAYVKQNQIYHAKCDLQEALKLDPQNEQIKKDLEKLK